MRLVPCIIVEAAFQASSPNFHRRSERNVAWLGRAPSRLTSAPFRLSLPKKVAASIYRDPRWKKLLAKVIAKRGRKCEDCGRSGCRIFGDHVIELKDGGAPFDEENVRLRCGSCHSLKTAAAKRERAGLREGGGSKP